MWNVTFFFTELLEWPTSVRNSGPNTRTASDLWSISKSTVLFALTVNLLWSRPPNAASPMYIVGPSLAISCLHTIIVIIYSMPSIRGKKRFSRAIWLWGEWYCKNQMAISIQLSSVCSKWNACFGTDTLVKEGILYYHCNQCNQCRRISLNNKRHMLDMSFICLWAS